MTRTFTVTLEDMTQYSVKAKYGVMFEYDTFSCWLEVLSVMPITASDVALDDKRMSDIESALSYLIIDECEDLNSLNDDDVQWGHPC